MPGLIRLTFCVVLLLFSSIAARADEGFYPLRADDGTIIANHRVPEGVEAQIEKLQGVVVAANPKGRVTLYEFYDLNCPYCRKASADIDELVRSNRDLRLVLVSFPVLGIPSILAARVEYAVAKLATPQQFYKFHRLVYAGRGIVDDKRAFEAARGIGLDMAKVQEIASAETFATDMKTHLRIGDALGIKATPGLVIKGVTINGYPGKAALERIVKSAQRCNAVICESAPR